MPVDLIQLELTVQLQTLRRPSLRSIALHGIFAANIWNMIDAFWNGLYLAGALIGALVLLMARWMTESTKPSIKARMKALEGAVLQLDPHKVKNPMFAGCFMVVSEMREWGAIGYIQGWGENGQPGGRAYYRAEWGEFQPVGKAVWTIGPEE